MEYLDNMFDQFSQAFLGIMDGEGDIPDRASLNVAALDYSPKSLKAVDNYLNIIYKSHKELSDIEYQNIVVWAGAYVGEVIRRNAVTEYHWINYDDYMKDKDADRRRILPLTLPTHAFLFSVNFKSVTMPMNKIARWLDEGPDNNVEYYAGVDIKRTQVS